MSNRNRCSQVRMLDINDRILALFIDLETDATFVVDEDGNEIGLEFDSSTYVHYKDKRIGKLRLPFNGEPPNIHFVKYSSDSEPDTAIDTGVYKEFVECYLDAEVVVIKHLIVNNIITLEE